MTAYILTLVGDPERVYIVPHELSPRELQAAHSILLPMGRGIWKATAAPGDLLMLKSRLQELGARLRAGREAEREILRAMGCP